MRDINQEHKNTLKRADKLAIFVTKKIGTMGFFFLIAGWTTAWLLWNTLGPIEVRFDPYPAFVLWLFISNLIQILFLPLIMVGQNLLGRHAELRAEADFEINKRAEEKIESVLAHLQSQHRVILEIMKKLE